MKKRVPRRSAVSRLSGISIGLILSSILHVAAPSFLFAFGGYLEPEITLQESYSDNFLLDPDLKKTVFWTTISPSLKLELIGERIDLNGELSSNINWFLDESDFNTTDYFFNLSPRYKVEKGTVKLMLAARRDTTLQDELIESGLILNRSERTLLTVHPSAGFSITEHASIGIGYRFSMADYSDGESAGLFDYRDHFGVASLLYQATERSRITVSLSYSNYRVPSQGSSDNTRYAQLGITHHFSDSTQGTFFAGGYQNSQRGTDDRKKGMLFSGGLNKKFEQTAIRTNLDRRVVPSGSGSLSQSDHLSFFVKRQFSVDIDGSLILNLYENRNITERNAGKNTYNQISSVLQWLWTEQWFLSVSHSYTWAKNDGGKRTKENAGFLMLKYKWPKSIFSIQVLNSSRAPSKAQ